MRQGSSNATTSATASGAGSASVLTDEQILGLEPVPDASAVSVRHFQESAGVLAGDTSLALSAGEESLLVSQPEAERDSSADVSRRPRNDGIADDSAEPAWLKTLNAQPEAAAEARRWRQAALDAATLDADYFSAEPGARAGLAARLHQTDPAAFRSMLADAARILAERDPQGLAELARQLGAEPPTAPNGAAKSVAQAARHASSSTATPGGAARLPDGQAQARVPVLPDAGRDGGPGAFPADAYRQFASAMNDDVERQVRNSIDRTLAATLPDGIADGARRRIGDDIFRDLNATLSADRELSAQINDALRGWRFDAATRQQVAGLLAGRARTVLPEVARRVVSEWTSSVLASDRAKNARIESAAARRDVTGGRLPEPVASSVRLGGRPVDYSRTSDEQILEM